ncbi:MAG TPA: hypothetical protein VJA66_01315 [Thermoanaerobaculia bacterium]
MTFLSCLAIGIAFALAVGLLVLAGVLLGWALPAAIERSRRLREQISPRLPDDGPPPEKPTND